MRGRWYSLAPLVLTLAQAGLAGESTCSVTHGGPDGRPIIFGKRFDVPALVLRFEDGSTKRPIIPTAVNVHYYSQWIQAPAIEHSWGAWSDLDDWARCVPQGRSEMTIPAYAVTPRGWYNGKYIKFPFTLAGSREPRFDRIEMVIEYDRYAPRLIIKAGDLKQYNGRTVLLKLPRAGHATAEFLSPSDH